MHSTQAAQLKGLNRGHVLSMLCQGCSQSVRAPPTPDRPDVAAMQDYELANGDVEAPATRVPATPSPGMLQYVRSKEAQLGMLSMLLLVSPAVAEQQHS